jgi:methylmalonyl-CoA mutase
MNELFSSFKTVSADEWEAQVSKDLKEGSINDLAWQHEDGFTVKPFYTLEDRARESEPAFTHADWQIGIRAQQENAGEINKYLLKSLQVGATSIIVDVRGSDLPMAVEGVEFQHINATFICSERTLADVAQLISLHPGSGRQISVLPKEMNETEYKKFVVGMIALSKKEGVRLPGADTLRFHNQSCFASYEVALVFSQLAEFLDAAGPEIGNSAITVRMGVSEDYFTQISKLRAVRRLWFLIRREYNISNELYMIVETGLSNRSLSDSYNNLLRSTVESMAAVVGGCNELIVQPFDAFFPERKNLGERMAINQQLILKEESYLSRMGDVACGSFYIEDLTDKVAIKGLEIFKDLISKGGYSACLKNGTIDAVIQEQAQKRSWLIKEGKQPVIGVNKFRNEKEDVRVDGAVMDHIKKLAVSNPVLKYELEHFFQNYA